MARKPKPKKEGLPGLRSSLRSNYANNTKKDKQDADNRGPFIVLPEMKSDPAKLIPIKGNKE